MMFDDSLKVVVKSQKKWIPILAHIPFKKKRVEDEFPIQCKHLTLKSSQWK